LLLTFTSLSLAPANLLKCPDSVFNLPIMAKESVKYHTLPKGIFIFIFPHSSSQSRGVECCYQFHPWNGFLH
jgi:hypothetical protein